MTSNHIHDALNGCVIQKTSVVWSEQPAAFTTTLDRSSWCSQCTENWQASVAATTKSPARRSAALSCEKITRIQFLLYCPINVRWLFGWLGFNGTSGTQS